MRDDGPASDRGAHRRRDQHRGAQPVDTSDPWRARQPVREHDVQSEQRRVAERQRHAERLATQLNGHEREHSGDREHERQPVAQ